MKSIKQFAKYLLIVTVALNFTSCWSFSVDDPELKKQHDSYLTLVEYHALKQVLMYEYFGLFSNDFQNTNLFEYEPTQEECMAYFTKIEQLLAYEEKITEAANSLQNTNSQVLSSDDFLLKSAMAKWDWLLKYVPFKGKNIELRNQIVSMSKDFTDEQRKYLFDLLYASPEWKGGALNETQFFSKMESGELDNSILRIHNTFEEDGERGDYFTWAEQNKLLSAQLAYDYGKESLKTGEKVLVTTVENLNPAIGTSIKILDYGNKFLNYINDYTNGKTTEQVKEEVKQNIEAKYAESGLSQSETPQQQALSIVEQAQRLANVARVNKNPASVVSDVSGWGGVKITSNDQTLIPDVVFAEKLYDEIGANIILATKMLKNELNEWLVPLPEGDWDIVALDNKGRSDTIRDWSVITKNFGVADVAYNSNVIEEEDDTEENFLDKIEPIDWDPNFRTAVIKSCLFGWSTINNRSDYDNNQKEDIILNDGSFSVSYNYSFEGRVTQSHASWVFSDVDETKKGLIKGKIHSNEKGDTVVSFIANQEIKHYHKDHQGYIKSYKEQLSINVLNVPIVNNNEYSLTFIYGFGKEDDGYVIKSSSYYYEEYDTLGNVINVIDYKNDCGDKGDVTLTKPLVELSFDNYDF